MNTSRPENVEIMAPVSNEAMLLAAIHNGADSVYMGMPGFNARGRADDLRLADLEAFINTAHIYGVKVYIAFNILIFDNELDLALNAFLQVRSFGPDAWIVQDAGLALLLKSVDPDVVLHASTQMTITNDRDIAFYSDPGFRRFTLARELSVNEINIIRNKTDVELETFIHGSLCIAVSGQCFTSSGFGGRSANRGECAQSCRHEYELYSDGKKISTDGNFLVSPRDLIGAGIAVDLAEAGINALKIEGRLKSPEYVAASVELYRSLLDKHESAAPQNFGNSIIAARVMFNRDGRPGWLEGVNSRDLVDSQINSHTGAYLGQVCQVKNGKYITIKISYDAFSDFAAEDKNILQKGDGIAIKARNEIYGGHVYDVKIYKNNNTTMADLYLANDFAYNKIDMDMPVFLSSSVSLQKKLAQSYKNKNMLKRIPVDIFLEGNIGENLCLTLHDFVNNRESQIFHEVKVYSKLPLEESRNQNTNARLIEKELGALDGSPYCLRKFYLKANLKGFFPNRVLKELRQEAVLELSRQRAKSSVKNISVINDKSRALLSEQELKKTGDSLTENKLHLLVRNPVQLDSVLNMENLRTHSIYLDFVYGHELSTAVEKIKKRGILAGIASARIYKPSEVKQLDYLLSLKPDVILARNSTVLQYFTEKEAREILLIGDFSLNITNRLSANYFLKKGFCRLTLSMDLVYDYGREQDIQRILDFLKQVPAHQFEMNINYYLPSFYMDFCLFTKYLGNSMNSPDCGFPCKDRPITLMDRKGEMHPVIADQNCRNTMFNGRQKNLFYQKNAQNILKTGIKNFRMEFCPDNKHLKNDLAMVNQICETLF